MKKWYQSSTILINLVPVLLGLLDILLVSKSVGDEDVVLILMGVANILRRFQAPVRVKVVEKAVI